jgi:hypothetical protein
MDSMKTLRTLSLISYLLTTLAIPALAQITLNSPASGAEVVSPFALSATGTTCSSQQIVSMGYSLDDSGNITVVTGGSVQAQIDSPVGLHTVHLKAWGNGGAECDADMGVAVTPSNAINVSNIQRLGTWNWLERNDAAVGGTSTGATTFTNYGFTRQFHTTFTNWGAELYYVSFGRDATVHNFMYDAWVTIASPNTMVDNLEMDMNQVTANGQTVIFGFQCDGNSNTWDYTTNSGTPQQPVDLWVHSNAACNVQQWSPNVWHHVQISYSRDDSGNVTYNAVSLDGSVSNINATVPSSFGLGWTPTLLTNFEVDGRGSNGSSDVYLNDLSVYRW